ncbi:MAG: hypothetical protein IKD00_04700, partial [Candidatus Methanomethylophilaceae archaeon]|nr:hypothetical protein [Candidatus Methanomethylophilaceae archaeon]
IWGAPGTGKTQFVLATCLKSEIDRGMRVAVFAPTNNAVEQVLKGILKAFPEKELGGGILRLGVPSREFLRDHPRMCEDKQAQRRLEDCRRDIDNLEEVLMERACDGIHGRLMDIRSRVCMMSDASDSPVPLSEHPEIASELKPMLDLAERLGDKGALSRIGDTDDTLEIVSLIGMSLFDRERPAKHVTEYHGWSDADLADRITELEEEAEVLSAKSVGVRMQAASIIAGTPLQFISRFRPKGSEENGRLELDVDHIYLDEAGYCNLPCALALFTNNVPVTFLGDHQQLPPVCELDEDMLRRGLERGNSMRSAFLWNMSALYCESLVRMSRPAVEDLYLRSGDPAFEETAREDLTESRRFGRNLAAVLDEHVYRNGMTGSGDGNLEILHIDALCTKRKERENLTEASMISEFLRRERPNVGDVAVLTPYAGQVRLLKRMVEPVYRECVGTVHGSQGREWDTVILSVADNGILSREVPFRFTSSKTDMGRKVVNTAVSRAKRRLVMVCDYLFWKDMEGELIADLLKESTPYVFGKRRRVEPMHAIPMRILSSDGGRWLGRSCDKDIYAVRLIGQ